MMHKRMLDFCLKSELFVAAGLYSLSLLWMCVFSMYCKSCLFSNQMGLKIFAIRSCTHACMYQLYKLPCP